MKLLFMKGSSQKDMSLGPLSLGFVYKHNQSIERTTFSLSFTTRYHALCSTLSEGTHRNQRELDENNREARALGARTTAIDGGGSGGTRVVLGARPSSTGVVQCQERQHTPVAGPWPAHGGMARTPQR